jgi:tetratricopeptide (TPR) repeat protein
LFAVCQLISLVGQCYLSLSDYSKAQTHFERALKVLRPKGNTSADAAVLACVKENKVWLARAMYHGSPAERGQALAMFEHLIAEDEHNVAALTHYAAIAIKCGKKGEVLPYLLRALVAAQAQGAAGHSQGGASNKANVVSCAPKPSAGAELDPQLVELVQVLLTDVVMLPDGVQTLFLEMHAASTNYAALSFIAQTVKVRTRART